MCLDRGVVLENDLSKEEQPLRPVGPVQKDSIRGIVTFAGDERPQDVYACSRS